MKNVKNDEEEENEESIYKFRLQIKELQKTTENKKGRINEAMKEIIKHN